MFQIKTHNQLYPQLFEAIQMSGIFKDSKYFVDAKPNVEPSVILNEYLKQCSQSDFDLTDFVDKHFELPDLIGGESQEYSQRPIREYINKLWDILERPADKQEQSSSLVELPNNYLVPGGRFREIYYWDSYFTMLGLIDSGRINLVRAMVDNFAYLIDHVGFIPNGNRSYFCSRSQPPVFSLMVDLLAQATNVSETYVRYLPQLQKEYSFWMSGHQGLVENGEATRRVVKFNNGFLNRYWDDSDEPRAESYREDVELASKSQRDSSELYRNIRAACESGWDFTSRWFQNPQDISSIVTTRLLPVDLNSLMHNLELMLSKAHGFSGNTDKRNEFKRSSTLRKKAIQEYFFDHDLGLFVDLKINGFESTKVASLATAFPLFFKLANKTQAEMVATKLQQRFLNVGGWVTTLNTTDQQWDSPNGWAPLQWICYQGLKSYGFDTYANDGALRWIENNMKVYELTGKLVEKYNVINLGIVASGGEYEVQHGFGWTNGVLLRLMNELGV